MDEKFLNFYGKVAMDFINFQKSGFRRYTSYFKREFLCLGKEEGNKRREKGRRRHLS